MKKFKLLAIGTSGITDPEFAGRIVFVNTLSFTIGCLLLLIAPPACYFLKLPPSVTIPVSIEFLINGSVIYLNHRKKYLLASLTLYFLQCLAVLYFSLLLGDLFHLQFVFMFLISIIFLIFKSKTTRIITLTATLIILTVLQITYYFDALRPVYTNVKANYFAQTAVMYGVLILMLFVSKRYVRSNDTNADLKRANHLIKIFFAQITHELRTPLDSMHQVTQLLKKEVQKDPHLDKIQSLVDIGFTVSCDARNIVNNVLGMAEIEAGKIPPVENDAFEVNPFLERVLEVHKILAERENITLRLYFDRGMPEVIIGDLLNLNQILTNLLTNALKYGAKGSTVNVAVKRQEQTWELKVSNYGPGIPAEKMETIFDPFVTGRTGQVQGSGLGLYIVKTKVTSMKGTIRVESLPDDQTVFTIVLPLVEGNPKAPPDGSGPDADIDNLNGVHVLVAEDDKLSAFLLSRFLKEMGCTFTMVKNGQDLLDTILKKCPGDCPDIIILDYHMPVLNGEETIRALKRIPELSHIPIIVATGDLYSDTLDRLLAVGASTYIKKPIDHVALKKTIGLHLKNLPAN